MGMPTLGIILGVPGPGGVMSQSRSLYNREQKGQHKAEATSHYLRMEVQSIVSEAVPDPGNIQLEHLGE